MALLPGIFDTQFLRGQTDERAFRTAHLFKDYYPVIDQLVAKTNLKAIPFPMARVIAVEQEIPQGFEIHPYDRVSEYIENNELIAMAWCYCRHYAKLLGDPCSKPAEGCIAFGRDAKYLLDRKFGWAVTKEEARSFLRRAEEVGLVHCSSNTTKYLTFFCNCCICHCSILKSFKKYGKQGSAAVSGFITELDPGKCSACGDCIEKCPMEALIMKGEDLVYKDDLCIGCGLCSSVCPTGALKLIIRKDTPVPPRDARELYSRLNSTEQVSNYFKG
jgi:NAD-dependent dihydropyrimidine dehydrogenase PreA subunit